MKCVRRARSTRSREGDHRGSISSNYIDGCWMEVPEGTGREQHGDAELTGTHGEEAWRAPAFGRRRGWARIRKRKRHLMREPLAFSDSRPPTPRKARPVRLLSRYPKCAESENSARWSAADSGSFRAAGSVLSSN